MEADAAGADAVSRSLADSPPSYTAVVRAVLNEDGWNVAIPFTTRPARMGERDGHNYNFVTVERFQEMLAAHKFVEHGQNGDSGHWYGTVAEEATEGGCELPPAIRLAACNNTIPFTTRPARMGERDGHNYNFVTVERFQEMLAAHKFVEHGQNEDSGHWYGTAAVTGEFDAFSQTSSCH
jgi:guanylate kinase